MRVVVRCADLVPDLFEALSAKDQDTVDRLKEEIFVLESEADDVRRELRRHLPRSLFLPVDRRDLLQILEMQDTIANVAQDIAGLLVERRMTVPEPMAESLVEFVQDCVAVVHLGYRIIEQLDELLQMGFRGKEADHVEEMIAELNAAESETDRKGLEITRLLFKHEDDLPPVSVMFWYQLIQWIGDLADYAEKSSNRLHLLMAR